MQKYEKYANQCTFFAENFVILCQNFEFQTYEYR